MADSEHLRILKQGVKAFNEWRDENPDIEPNLIGANLNGANLRLANLSGADLSIADLNRAYLVKAHLSEANLNGAHLRLVNLSGADLSMADLVESDLSGARLSGADLSEADLSGADLSEAWLNRASLSGANLKGADLSGADLREAILAMVILSGANLNGADLSGAHLSRANLNKANFSRAVIGYTTIGDIDLSNVLDLESTIHNGPSFIGIDTIFRSGGKIPRKFLEDAGVPNIFIEYMGTLTVQAFQYYSCFISYSTNDKDFADRIYADLRKEGVRCWFAPEDMKGGKKIHQQLDEAIRFYDKLLLVISESSINSDWVANEIRWARKREKQEGRQKLFPVSLIDYGKLKSWELFDADTATDLAAEVRSYFIPDFTNWKDHNDYLASFKRLLRDLQAEE